MTLSILSIQNLNLNNSTFRNFWRCWCCTCHIFIYLQNWGYWALQLPLSQLWLLITHLQLKGSEPSQLRNPATKHQTTWLKQTWLKLTSTQVVWQSPQTPSRWLMLQLTSNSNLGLNWHRCALIHFGPAQDVTTERRESFQSLPGRHWYDGTAPWPTTSGWGNYLMGKKLQEMTSWWFQPFWKTLGKMGIFPK